MEEAPSNSSGVSCSVCGSALQPFARVCGGCGALVNACRSCGQRLLAGDRFCPSCGMTAELGAVTQRVSGGTSTDAPALSPWTGIFEKLQSATLGEYHVVRELGRGGMAAVFLAHDVRLDRKVAIKVMSPMLATDKAMVERFRREAKTGAGLKHPNIGTVYRVLESDGLYFFVMDFVRGRPLDMIIRRNGVLSIPAVRALLYQIGSGLAYAHRRKIYHRDVKPGNVLVSAIDGIAVVTDFGIAKVAESPNQTQTGAVVGTPAYMAPEQILGREIGAEVDQYALGVMAYEMLTGTPPFVGTNFVVMHAHTEIQPRTIRESRPDCPAELDEAIMRMLAKEPTQRWPSLPHALAAMGATLIGEDDPIREELIGLATPDDAEAARFSTNTPASPAPPTTSRAASVSSVVIYAAPPVIEVGDSFRLTASPRDSAGDVVPDVPVEWSTSDTSIIGIQSDGLVTALAVGSAEIIARSGRARGVIAVSIVPGRVVDLQLSVPPGVLVAGDRIQLAARAVDKHQRPLAYSVRWGVANADVANISPDGVLEARAPGLVEVYAEAHGVRTGARVEVASPAVDAVSLSFEPQRPVVGDRIYVNPTMLDVDGHRVRDRAMVWSLGDRSLVKVVTDGAYEAVAEGTLRVTVTTEGKSATTEIVITAAPVATVRISHAPQQLVVGNSFKLAGTAHDARGNMLADRRIAWSVADLSIGAVTDTGTLTALAPGELRIIASCEGKSVTLPISIQPPAIGGVRISGVPQVVYVKMPFRLAAIITDGWGKQVSRTVEWRSSNVSVVSIAPTGQATASAIGHVRISAVVEGVEGSAEIDVVEPPVPKVVVVPVLPPVAREIPNLATARSSSAAVTITEPIEVQSAQESVLESELLPIELRPTEPLGVPIVPEVPITSAPPRQLAPTPVLAPLVAEPSPVPMRRSRRRRALVGAGVIAIAVAALGVTMMSRRDTHAAPVRSDTTSNRAPVQQSAAATAAPAPIAASYPTPVENAPTAAEPEAPKVRDVFRISIQPQSPMHVGESETLHANVERVSGKGRMPRVTWTSNKPSVVRVDANTGAIAALAEGQAVIRAVGGGARADMFVSVLPAPVAAAPQPTHSAAPSADELRARGVDALRQAANGMVTALQSKDAARATQMFGDGINSDASDLIKTMKDQYGFSATVVQINQPQLVDRTGSIDYRLTVSWVSAAGPTRTRNLTLRAEAEQRGGTWTVVRHRILSGWR